MASRGIDKKGVIEAMSLETGYPEQIISTVVDAFIHVVVEGTLSGSEVKIRHLGTFYPYQTKSRSIYNPSREECVQTTGRATVNFRLSPTFQKKLQES
jgi:nucleoid DNA-binding protein